MQIVIDIPDTLYNTLQKNKGTDIELDFTDRLILQCAAEKGKPLPKGHGRLIDVDHYRKDFLEGRTFEPMKTLDLQPTIIEADKWNNSEYMAIKALEQEPCEDAIANQHTSNALNALEEDAISRQAALEIQAKYAEHLGATKFWQMRDDIKALPSVKPQEPKTAYWIWDGKSNVYRCSYCNQFPWRINTEENDEVFIDMKRTNAYKFCSNCGRRMVEPQESEG